MDYPLVIEGFWPFMTLLLQYVENPHLPSFVVVVVIILLRYERARRLSVVRDPS